MKKSLSIAIAIMIFSPALVQVTSAQTNRDDSAQESKRSDNSFDATCIGNAIQLREDVIAAAFTKFSAAQTQALSTRKANLLEALRKPTARERADARKAAHTTFRTTSKANHSELKSARKAAWDTYRSTMRNCKGGRTEVSNDTPSSGSATESL